jgi:hypothetical protein
MLHLAISCASYIVFFIVKVLTPTQTSSWRLQESSRVAVPQPQQQKHSENSSVFW